MFYINLPLINEKDFADRYDFQKFVEMQSDVYDLLDSYFAMKIKELPSFGITNIQGEEFRPDLISYRVYKSVNFWYILMIYNDWISVFDVIEGNIFKYPKLSDVEELYFKLNALQKNNIISGVL